MSARRSVTDWEPIRSPRDEVDRHAGLMPRKLSAGLLLYRRGNQDDEIVLEVLLAHMGGPFWAQKDDGAWSIPKGEYESGEDPFAAAKREFEEELGSAPPLVVYRDLGSVSQPGGKLVTAWAAEADFDAAGAVSNTFELEWPRGSGVSCALSDEQADALPAAEGEDPDESPGRRPDNKPWLLPGAVGVVIVRCMRGGLFETVWIPLASFKAIRLGPLRIQRCPVHHRVEIVQQVDPATLSDEEHTAAARYPAQPIP